MTPFDRWNRPQSLEVRVLAALMSNPLYRQIAEDLSKQTEYGELQLGKQQRTELELKMD